MIDDTIEEKEYTDENELVCWHWDHSKGRHVKGINFLSALYVTAEAALPVAFDLVTNQVKFRYVINDSWYSSSDNTKLIKRDLHKEFVMPLKSNRKVALSKEEKASGQYQAVNQLELSLDATREVWLEEIPFPLLLTKQVFINEDQSEGTLYLVTSDLTLGFDHIQQLYQRSWSVEEYHKSLKQNVSLERSPARITTTHRNHLFASHCAYIKLESLRWQTKLNHFALKSKIYQSALKAAYSELVKLNPQPLAA